MASIGGLTLLAMLAFYPEPAQAYVGPPAALGAASAVLGLGMAASGLLFHATVKAIRRTLRRLPPIASTWVRRPPTK